MEVMLQRNLQMHDDFYYADENGGFVEVDDRYLDHLPKDAIVKGETREERKERFVRMKERQEKTRAVEAAAVPYEERLDPAVIAEEQGEEYAEETETEAEAEMTLGELRAQRMGAGGGSAADILKSVGVK